jgi:hypothetical protein
MKSGKKRLNPLETTMKTTQIILIIVMIALSSCSRRTTSLKSGVMPSPDPIANQEPIAVEPTEPEEEDDTTSSNHDSSNASNGGNSQQSGGASSGSTQTTTTTTIPVPVPAVVKRPVYRAVHPYYGNAYWTASQSNLALVAANYGFTSQGHAFNTAIHITADCQVPLYACSNPTIGNFIYHAADCGGSPNSQLEFLGYVCQSGNIPTVPLYGMRSDSGYVYYTTSLAEVNLVQRYGYYVIGAYYTPQ